MKTKPTHEERLLRDFRLVSTSWQRAVLLILKCARQPAAGRKAVVTKSRAGLTAAAHKAAATRRARRAS
jgi:hypothetical protein